MNTPSPTPQRSTRRATHLLYLLYSLTSYLLFLLTTLYLIGFLGRLLVPRHIDSGPQHALVVSIVVDILLITLFGVQHSFMARKGFKARLARVIPAPIERATYVLCSSLVLVLLLYAWRPIATPVWDVTSTVTGALLSGLFWLGWGLVLLSTFLISHFELFGLKQAIRAFQDAQPRSSQFLTPSLYKVVRHPMYLGFLIAFWATPVMSVGHLLFALTSSVYILIGAHLEEKDLVSAFGRQYLEYQQRVGMLLPFRKASRATNNPKSPP
ncbi:methanethiol S-methyltransferase [Pseudomonas sp. H1h]|uniref:methanethiol S-methyltransferase n=1 Tax=Pseudomonas sp. H1h TaxID=1397280 RepID=UPI00046AA84B|nr:methanethiol S-methyltransferase [Pseudomonas sp. H1h]